MSDGLKLCNTNTMVEKVEINSEVISRIKVLFREKSYIVAYHVNEVLFGTIEENEFNFPDEKQIEVDYLLQLRVFNKNKELYLRKKKNLFVGRLRTDNDKDVNENKKIQYVEANQIILGTQSKNIDGKYTVLTEAKLFHKGIRIPDIVTNISEKKRLAIKTRNYIGYNGALQAEYIDSRFVEFSLVEEGGVS